MTMTLTAGLARRAGKFFAALLVLGLLLSCGGSTEQIVPFAPTRLLVFGDEMSVLTKELPLGRKYSVNALGSDNVTIDCSLRPLWIQVLADTYLFSFEECNTAATIVKPAKIYATVGAQSIDFPAQVAAARAAVSPFTSTDLVTVLLGANDVLDLYRTRYVPDPAYPNFLDNPTYKAIITELESRGAQLGREITALFAEGPKVIVSTMPLMNLTPYALQQAVDRADPTVLNVLLNFSNAFNTQLRVNIPNNGRYWGLVELDALLNAGVTGPYPNQYGIANPINAVCSVALPDCTTNTLVVGGNATTWLWASDVWMGSTAHLNLGNFARGRALGNPF